jgi:hypothetical protein
MFDKELNMRKNIKDIITGKMACQANNFNILHGLFFFNRKKGRSLKLSHDISVSIIV